MKTLIAVVFSAAFALLLMTGRAPVTQINNSVSRAKTQAVQAEAPRKEPTLNEQEKALIQQQAESKPETVAEAPKPEPQQPLTDEQRLMQAAGIPQNDWGATDYIVSHESSWDPTARNPRSGAYGLCQSLPAGKMASAGADYMTNPVTQLKWCHDYANSRYGGWFASMHFWKVNQWW